eukprot:1190563-Prorocentrum_minimum.AAC.2
MDQSDAGSAKKGCTRDLVDVVACASVAIIAGHQSTRSPPVVRLVRPVGIYPLPSPDWSVHPVVRSRSAVRPLFALPASDWSV